MRRAANRLREKWKRDPWTSGRTIDLGEHEHRFQVESGLACLTVPVAPAVLDWLRWRYRRLQVDSRRDEEWARVIREDYPRRVRDARAPSQPYDVSAAGDFVPHWAADTPLPGSKRARADAPRLAPVAPTPPLRQRDAAPDDELELARVAYEHRDVLGPLLGLCCGVNEQRSVIRTLKDYLGRPGDLAAAKDWLAVVSSLRARA